MKIFMKILNYLSALCYLASFVILISFNISKNDILNDIGMAFLGIGSILLFVVSISRIIENRRNKHK